VALTDRRVFRWERELFDPVSLGWREAKMEQAWAQTGTTVVRLWGSCLTECGPVCGSQKNDRNLYRLWPKRGVLRARFTAYGLRYLGG